MPNQLPCALYAHIPFSQAAPQVKSNKAQIYNRFHKFLGLNSKISSSLFFQAIRPAFPTVPIDHLGQPPMLFGVVGGEMQHQGY